MVPSHELDIIGKNHQGDLKMCCTKMCQFWLELDTAASWSKLIDALKSISKNALAETIRKEILQGT